MIALIRRKAAAAAMTHVHPVASSAESFAAPLSTFDLATVGNAFHRLHRDAVAASMFGWLKPGGHLALVWGDSPWVGEADWQSAFSDVLDRWKTSSSSRIPTGWEEPRQRRPDRLVLTEAGFEFLGAFGFPTQHRWIVDELIGWVYSTSLLPRHVVGGRAVEFEADMHSSLDRFASLNKTIDFAYELYRRPLQRAEYEDGRAAR